MGSSKPLTGPYGAFFFFPSPSLFLFFPFLAFLDEHGTERVWLLLPFLFPSSPFSFFFSLAQCRSEVKNMQIAGRDGHHSLRPFLSFFFFPMTRSSRPDGGFGQRR